MPPSPELRIYLDRSRVYWSSRLSCQHRRQLGGLRFEGPIGRGESIVLLLESRVAFLEPSLRQVQSFVGKYFYPISSLQLKNNVYIYTI